MSLQKLVNQEYFNWQQRMQKETCGTYILIYIGFIFSVIFSCCYGFYYEKDDLIVLFTCACCVGGLYQVATMYLSSVKESGKRVNIFEKYVYTPVDLDMLIKAKMIVVAKIVGLPIVLSQLVSVLVRIIDLDKDGGSLLDINVWIPLITGGIFLIIKYIEFKNASKKIKLFDARKIKFKRVNL